MALGVALALALAGGAAADDPVDSRVREIGQQLKCPVCQSVSVADSPSEMASQMRQLIRKQVVEGQSSEAIIQYFVDRYGEEALMAPPKRGLGLAFWLVPALAVAGGLAAVYGLLRRWRQPTRASVAATSPDGSPDLSPYEERVRRELAEEER
jgi:cytochrome c-type biogenesis protein CcmH